MIQDSDLQLLLQNLNRPWSGYKKVRKGVMKRIHRHMEELGCQNFEEYLARVLGEKPIREACEQLLTVSISRFFRTKKLWEDVEKEILPSFPEGPIKVWVAGCARGEEVYSLKIVEDKLGWESRLQITATDVNPLYLEQAQEGVFSYSSLKELSEEDREKSFEKSDKMFRVIPKLRTEIEWREHDLLDTPPGEGYHIIFMRNSLLTYCEEPEILKALDPIITSLEAGGYLIIGSHENLPEGKLEPTSIPCAYRLLS